MSLILTIMAIVTVIIQIWMFVLQIKNRDPSFTVYILLCTIIIFLLLLIKTTMN